MRFRNRKDAGRQLAEALAEYKGKDVIVYALPRGGVVVGYEIAKALGAPLDLIITRKIGHPKNPEYAVGVVSEDGKVILNRSEADRLDSDWLQKVISDERGEAKRRRKLYSGSRRPPEAEGKTVILVDDGIATGLTFSLAIEELEDKSPREIVAALPVAPKSTADEISKRVDKLVILESSEPYLGAVGAYYTFFNQVSDEEVGQLLERVDTRG